jgi:hypothetical protein
MDAYVSDPLLSIARLCAWPIIDARACVSVMAVAVPYQIVTDALCKG